MAGMHISFLESYNKNNYIFLQSYIGANYYLSFFYNSEYQRFGPYKQIGYHSVKYNNDYSNWVGYAWKNINENPYVIYNGKEIFSNQGLHTIGFINKSDWYATIIENEELENKQYYILINGIKKYGPFDFLWWSGWSEKFPVIYKGFRNNESFIINLNKMKIDGPLKNFKIDEIVISDYNRAISGLNLTDKLHYIYIDDKKLGPYDKIEQITNKNFNNDFSRYIFNVRKNDQWYIVINNSNESLEILGKSQDQLLYNDDYYYTYIINDKYYLHYHGSGGTKDLGPYDEIGNGFFRLHQKGVFFLYAISVKEQKNNKYYIVINDEYKKYGPYDWVDDPIFDEKGENWAYRVKKNNNYYIIENGVNEYGPFNDIISHHYNGDELIILYLNNRDIFITNISKK